MFEEYEKRKKKNVSVMRSILDYGIGTIILVFGIFMLFRSKLNLAINEAYPPDTMDIVLGGMCVVYGAWRLYRGYQKKYFR